MCTANVANNPMLKRLRESQALKSDAEPQAGPAPIPMGDQKVTRQLEAAKPAPGLAIK